VHNIVRYSGLFRRELRRCEGRTEYSNSDVYQTRRALKYYVNLVFPIGWLRHGIVYLTGLFLLIQLTHLKLGRLDKFWHSQESRLYMILEHSCR